MGIDLHSSWRQVQNLGLTESNLGQFEHNNPGTEVIEDKCPWGKNEKRQRQVPENRPQSSENGEINTEGTFIFFLPKSLSP